MFIRYFVALCAMALCAVAINGELDAVPNRAVGIEERANPAAKIVAKLIGSMFSGAAVSCLGEAAEKCKQQWKNSKAAVKCGKDFLKTNKGRCTVGK